MRHRNPPVETCLSTFTALPGVHLRLRARTAGRGVASGWRQATDRKGRPRMSNHFTGLSLGPPLGDQRLDLCDLYAFVSPSDNNRTVLILNANLNADALHPDAIYRLSIDNDGDLLTDIALSYVFSKPQNGKQTFNVF